MAGEKGVDLWSGHDDERTSVPGVDPARKRLLGAFRVTGSSPLRRDEAGRGVEEPREHPANPGDDSDEAEQDQERGETAAAAKAHAG
jgi:hypothetical protein